MARLREDVLTAAEGVTTSDLTPASDEILVVKNTGPRAVYVAAAGGNPVSATTEIIAPGEVSEFSSGVCLQSPVKGLEALVEYRTVTVPGSVASGAEVPNADAGQTLVALGDGTYQPVNAPVLDATWPRFGAVGDNAGDQTTAIQAAIDAAEALSGSSQPGDFGGVVYLPAGTYIVDGLVMKEHVVLKGAGERATVIKAKSGGSATGIVSFPTGSVQGARIEDLQVQGNGVTGQHGIYAYAQDDGGGDGGWWYGGMRNVHVEGFDGAGIWLRGGATNLLPHQFLKFDHVRVYSSTNGVGLAMTGQCGQIDLTNCLFSHRSGLNTTAGNNVVMYRESNSPTSLSAVGSVAPYAITFNACSFQFRNMGCLQDAAYGVTYMGCWFEDCANGLKLQSTARGNVIFGTVFADINDGSGTGCSLEVDNSVITEFANYQNGTIDRMWKSSGSAASIVHRGGTTTANTIVSTNEAPVVTVSSNTLNILNHDVVLCASGTVKTITSRHQVGERIAIYCSGAVSFDNTDNLNFAGQTSVTVRTGQVAHFIKVDVGGGIEWYFLGATGAPGVEVRSVAAATTVTLPNTIGDGVSITGTTTIDNITATGWSNRRIILQTASNPTIRNNGGGTGNIRTTSGSDITTSANGRYVFWCDGTLWWQV